MDEDLETSAAFSAFFPLPFRVLALVGLGILGWATNLHGLEALGVDAPGALGLRSLDGHRSPLPTASGQDRSANSTKLLYTSIYRLLAAYSLWCFSAWAAFRYMTHSSVLLADVFRFIPAICAMALIAVLVSPFNFLFKPQRDLFLNCLWRSIASPFNRPIYFSDVIFADILTSFAKVLGDVWLSVCILLPGNSLLEIPVADNWTRWILPAIMSVPYAIRFRQCIIEHLSPNNSSRRPLMNALKYASSFPVILLSAAQRDVVTELMEEKGAEVADEAWHGEHPLFRMWLLAAAVNSLYSFWWDVTNDWGFELLQFRRPALSQSSALSPPRQLILPAMHSATSSISSASPVHSPAPSLDHAQKHNLHESGFSGNGRRQNWGLRPVLLYPLPSYPLLIFLNLVLRLTWSVKLSSHLHSQSEGSEVIFWVEVAEVLRRWMWVFVRVEWEVVKRGSMLRGRGPIMDESSEEEYEMVFDTRDSDD